MRKKIVAGNWKMNLTQTECVQLLSELRTFAEGEDFTGKEMLVCPPSLFLSTAVHELKDSPVNAGAQNIHQELKGAYTGEISGAMIKSLGVGHVILGHSERRAYFGETDETVKVKVDIALAEELTILYCCGEGLSVRENGKHIAHVTQQIAKSLYHLEADQWKNIVVAYEPIWAIGTGKTASPEQAEEMHRAIRADIAQKYSEEMADKVSILYGGSCKPANAKEIFSQANVDGGLIGGASLKSDSFIAIFQAL